MTLNRRDFLKVCCSSAAAIGVGARAKAWFAPAGTTTATNDTLVVVFLRGAMDGLSLLPPGANSPFRSDYEVNRTGTRVPTSGAGAALALANTTWALHPRASGLRDLYQSGHAAFIVAAGQVAPNPVVRSHFEAQMNLEFGVGGGSGTGVGWLSRHLASAALPAGTPMPAISMGDSTATSMLGSGQVITMANGDDFRLDGFHWSWEEDNPQYGLVGAVTRLNDFWASGSSALHTAGRKTLDSLALLRPVEFDLRDATPPEGYQPSGGANYDLANNDGFGEQLRNVAQLVKLGVGLRAVTIDLGNWDTHVGQGNPTQSYDWFGNQVESLSAGLSAFYTDLASDPTGNFMQHVSVLVVSEFGRRVMENSDSGTDHGYGNVMLALGGAVNGGQVFGQFNGLAGSQLYQGTDVAVTTDYRRVFSEALIRRLANPNIYYTFPGYTGYTPMGIFQGADLVPSNYDAIFTNGFDG